MRIIASTTSILRGTRVFLSPWVTCVLGLWLMSGLVAGTTRVSVAADAASQEASTYPLDDALRARCLDVLRQALRADDFWPAMHAAEALSLAGHGDEVRGALAPRLPQVEDDQQRCGLARELVRAGDRTYVAVMLGVLAAESDYGHTHAAESLYKVAAVGDGRLLRQAMAQEGNVKLQVMAAAALARCGNPRAMELLRSKLRSEDLEVSRLAAWVLARIGDSSDIAPLRAALARSEQTLARAYFQHALATLGDRDGLRGLERNLGDADASVRTYAATFAGDARATNVGDKLAALLDDLHLDARVRAAQSLLVLSRAAPPRRDEDISREVFAASPDHPRYSEGSIIARRDGSLLFATTEFINSGSDFAQARIVARLSRDEGRTWQPPRVLQENVGRRNVMSVSLEWLTPARAGAATLGMFYLVKNSFDDLKVYLRRSRDEGESFEDPILVTDRAGYHVMNNDRVRRLSSGRLLAPVALTEDVQKQNHFRAMCYLSDDGGESWRAGKGSADLERRGAMEPEVFETHDGRVAMILRTQLGYIAICDSRDGGDTWSRPVSWNVRAPEAPATLRRIPATGDLLLIWNDVYTPGAGHGGKRTPLAAAVSPDDGRTWQPRRLLETRTDHSYAYTSLTFVEDRAVMSYYVRDGKSGRISCRFRSLPVRWFYR